MSHKHTNALIHETSPYLLQHAHNPVDWMPWNDEAFKKAKDENKLLLISIGYSACHWCHVMEHETFEDEAVAQLMNEHFVCIKVDREERPDVDQVYMDAVQLITGRGGWPLNCFALPDGRPFHGGTYFPKNQWMETLRAVHSAFTETPEKIEEYAQRLTDGLQTMDDIAIQPLPEEFNMDPVDAAIGRWTKNFDTREGGDKGSPKFLLPVNLRFQLQYGTQSKDQEVLDHVNLTLKKMALGGIYDQLGGGFARYSVDDQWRVPHFEKMLYDNGQLLSIYAEAYRSKRDPIYARILSETADWIAREMTDESHAFYSALDADSEGEEGKFYVWKMDELKAAAGDDWDLLKEFYHIDSKGLWEHGNYILMQQDSEAATASSIGLKESELREKMASIEGRLLEVREQRIRPGLDDKCLTSWNALTSTGLIDAYVATGESRFLTLAEDNLEFLWTTQRKKDGSLWHSYKTGTSSINGYLEDYALLCEALLSGHEATLNAEYLQKAHAVAEYVITHFKRTEAGLFHFKSKNDDPLIVAKTEIHDNVIPSSNSIMATCLYKLGALYGKTEWIEMAKEPLAHLSVNYGRYPSGHSQWMRLHSYVSRPFYEVAILGTDCEEKRRELTQHFLPNVVICGGTTEGDIPILEGRLNDERTLFYVCEFGACQLPTTSSEEALDQMVR